MATAHPAPAERSVRWMHCTASTSPTRRAVCQLHPPHASHVALPALNPPRLTNSHPRPALAAASLTRRLRTSVRTRCPAAFPQRLTRTCRPLGPRCVLIAHRREAVCTRIPPASPHAAWRPRLNVARRGCQARRRRLEHHARAGISATQGEDVYTVLTIVHSSRLGRIPARPISSTAHPAAAAALPARRARVGIINSTRHLSTAIATRLASRPPCIQTADLANTHITCVLHSPGDALQPLTRCRRIPVCARCLATADAIVAALPPRLAGSPVPVPLAGPASRNPAGGLSAWAAYDVLQLTIHVPYVRLHSIARVLGLLFLTMCL
ncbi:hypothetical protein MSAN_00913000 [Mycena sanguinolenta]|uniref:Uncharacterized protein n=1 Tax=Mycena sanguinolenta TaxID=230812 RepID=A0A8H6YXE5_9AGAR|nr:hypothetical protein MSAN_00913000 [Mycena sanguinolenta]